MDANGVIEVLRAMGRRMAAEKDFLTELDNAIADGDHGINMARGFAAGVAAARSGVERTKAIVATKGRASYIGERSLGHQDPGATSFAFLLECVAGCL